MSPAFLRAAQFVLSKQIEGGLSLDPDDRGNWTGGAKGVGELKGSKYGISAMRYPHLDIHSLTVEQAREVYWRDYWCAHRCEDLPSKLALVYFDAVVNMRPEDAVMALQLALNVKADGVIGPVTLAAARVMDQGESVPNFLAERAMRYVSFKQFPKYGRGWLERVVRAGMEVARP
jgi:lysozyme family protein